MPTTTPATWAGWPSAPRRGEEGLASADAGSGTAFTAENSNGRPSWGAALHSADLLAADLAASPHGAHSGPIMPEYLVAEFYG